MEKVQENRLLNLGEFRKEILKLINNFDCISKYQVADEIEGGNFKYMANCPPNLDVNKLKFIKEDVPDQIFSIDKDSLIDQFDNNNGYKNIFFNLKEQGAHLTLGKNKKQYLNIAKAVIKGKNHSGSPLAFGSKKYKDYLNKKLNDEIDYLLEGYSSLKYKEALEELRTKISTLIDQIQPVNKESFASSVSSIFNSLRLQFNSILEYIT